MFASVASCVELLYNSYSYFIHLDVSGIYVMRSSVTVETYLIKCVIFLGSNRQVCNLHSIRRRDDTCIYHCQYNISKIIEIVA